MFWKRLVLVTLLIATLAAPGCSGQRLERDVVGEWFTSGSDLDTVLVFKSDGTGTQYNSVSPTVKMTAPDPGGPKPFTYAAEGSELALEFEDGGQVTLTIGSVTDGSLVVDATSPSQYGRDWATTWTRQGD